MDTKLKTQVPASYTHVGGKPNVGYVHRSVRLFGHSDVVPGKRHALNRSGSGYTACCGDQVAETYYDDWSGDRITGHVTPAADTTGTGMTCARCRKLLKVQKYEVQARPVYAGRTGAWYTVKGGRFPTKADAEAYCKTVAVWRLFRATEGRTVSRLMPLPIYSPTVGCSDCGRCCSNQGSPPFVILHPSLYHEPPPLGWGEGWPESERWKTIPDDALAVLRDYYTAGRLDRYDRGLPCLWYDETTRRCRWYDWRPEVCREFAAGEEDCAAFRAGKRPV